MNLMKNARNLLSFLLVINLLSTPCLAKELARGASHKRQDIHSEAGANSFKHALHSLLPNENIEISSIKGSIILSGAVSGVEVADKAERITKEFFGHSIKIVNFLKIKGSQQVMLRVKIGEVKRDALRKTVNGSSFEYLERQGLINTIAQPNLVAISGERAEFLAGGEFPVPTAQKEGNISIDYKSYGVKVAFTPLVLSPNRIRLNIEQELSELSDEANIMVAGFKIPSISSRRAKTTIELAPGESFMIAGLVKEDFKEHKGKETELVIAVTPYLVDPVLAKDLKVPTDNIYLHNKLEKSFINQMSNKNVKGAMSNKTSLTGPVGFIAE